MTTSFFTAAELNHIVFRYLHESGFGHTNFNFRHEAGIDKSLIDGNMVIPHATLVTLMHKGLQYIEMQANSTNDDKDDIEFVFLKPMDLITKNLDELRAIVRDKRRNVASEKEGKKDTTEKGQSSGKEKAVKAGCGIWDWNKHGKRRGRR